MTTGTGKQPPAPEEPALEADLILGEARLPDAAASTPQAPVGVTPEEAAELATQAAEMVAQLSEVTGSEELSVIDALSNLGVQSQRRAGAELDLLRGHLKEIFVRAGPSAEVWKSLLEMRAALHRIDPDQLTRRSLPHRILGGLPFVGRPLSGVKVLERLAVRHETVSQEVDAIEMRLRQGQHMLTRDNVELRKLYEQVEVQQVTVVKNAYLGELVMQELTQHVADTTEPEKGERLTGVLHDVATRVQDLRTVVEVQHQFFVSIQMTHENNTRLGQSVERTLALGTNVVTIGLAIQTALARQKRVLEATRRTREFLGEMIAANATAIKRHTAEIGDIYNSPVVAIEKIAQAHQDLVEAMETADRIKQEGIAVARENIARLAQMSASLERSAPGLPKARGAGPGLLPSGPVA